MEDNGCGMEEDVVSRIFDPFFTRKSVGFGIGLGLSICRDLEEALGGRIEVENEPGRGSVFRVTLPGMEASSQPGV